MTSSIPSTCCNTSLTDAQYGIYCSSTRIIKINWSSKVLSKSIPSDIGRLTGLTSLDLSYNYLSGPIPETLGSLINLNTLALHWNRFNGSIPEALGKLTKLESLYLIGNELSGPIPSTLGNLKSLKILRLSQNQLSGPIPASFGNLVNLQRLRLHFNQLNGSIPSTLANLSELWELYLSDNKLSGPIPESLSKLSKLYQLFLYNNQLTGYPSTLRAKEIQIFPNPMSDVPYDKVTPASIGTLSAVTWDVFLNTSVTTLIKRQQSQSTAPVTTEELVAMCPLKNVTELSAGCVSGIYNKFCRTPTNGRLLAQCHDAYNRAFEVSKFKALGNICFAWKNGPKSAACNSTVREFKAYVEMGVDPSTNKPIYLHLTAKHAEELRKNLFASPKYAPCVSSQSIKCTWT